MHDLIFPTAVSVTIWTNPVTFNPYRKAFASPIVTIEVGSRRYGPLQSKTLSIVQVPLKLLSYRGQGFYPSALVEDLEAGYGKFDLKVHGSMMQDVKDLKRLIKGSHNAFICVMSSPRAVLEMIAEHIQSNQEAAACIMMIPQLTTSYFRALLPLLRGLITICPSIAFPPSKKKSFMGSVVLRLGGQQVQTGRNVSLATWHKGSNLRD